MSAPMSPFRHTGEEFSPAEWGRAWAVHLFTTLGIVAAMLALRDVLVGNPKHAIIWLLLPLLVDGIDGPIARALEVERRVPLIDGFMLDLIIDRRELKATLEKTIRFMSSSIAQAPSPKPQAGN